MPVSGRGSLRQSDRNWKAECDSNALHIEGQRIRLSPRHAAPRPQRTLHPHGEFMQFSSRLYPDKSRAAHTLMVHAAMGPHGAERTVPLTRTFFVGLHPAERTHALWKGIACA